MASVLKADFKALTLSLSKGGVDTSCQRSHFDKLNVSASGGSA